MIRVSLPRIGTADAWRKAARGFLATGTPPQEISWGDTSVQAGLFDISADTPQHTLVTVPRSFLSMANSVVWHSDPSRFARLYAFLWRLRDAPHLMTDRGDADLAALRRMEKNVHRCQHKMKAFVRFRETGAPDADRRSFAAWFEPTHHTTEPTAQFFVRRFADMDWQIITPDVSVFFENGRLRFEVDVPQPDLPDDASEALWVTYFRNIFNPARLKVQAMQSEMPKKYWKNMPEAAAIPELIARAPDRAREMALAAPTLPPARLAAVQAQQATNVSAWDGTRDELVSAISTCTRCALHRTATQAVPGEGPADASLMIVGEQPGDEEDLTGRPFVGPAGRLFDQIAQQAGLDRKQVFVTNAVKHFKFRPDGKRRLHERPDAGETEHCRWWLMAEIAQIRPQLILALGATAARSLTGNGADLLARRGKVERGPDETPVLITVHPSWLLRLRDAGRRREASLLFCQDLELAVKLSQSQATLRNRQA
ncbi:UdgX family uracil-DNA binding protein [uncultured Roseobacter sp.]|uniref:UdgX family uracil-DNA binding protein n=1 Tax=uncultured Roseobacter sp. TaxID=114847 RepID=UPI002603978B|nr:UdgX family uracil-DNA binding protein [uncultured Roseobacter sp.]